MRVERRCLRVSIYDTNGVLDTLGKDDTTCILLRHSRVIKSSNLFLLLLHLFYLSGFSSSFHSLQIHVLQH
jgi:hypothetical protein